MKVDELDIGVGVEGVLVEKNRASSVMGHVEPISKNVMVDVLRCFLQGNDMPPACDLLFVDSNPHTGLLVLVESMTSS